MAWKATRAWQPGVRARVWRYMRFERLADLVQTRELHMTRLDAFEETDPHEGRWLAGADNLTFTGGVDDPAKLVSTLEAERHCTYVSCWTLRLGEQDHMWKQFNAEVAVTALYENLVLAGPDVAIGGVAYVGSLSEFVARFGVVNTYNLAFAKLPEFRQEQEIRLVHRDEGDDPPRSVRLPIDLELLRFEVRALPDIVADVRSLLAEAGLAAVKVRARGDAGGEHPRC